MNAFRIRNHDASVSREQLTDLWRVDCPTCGPVAIGQGYRADAMAIAARHKETHTERLRKSSSAAAASPAAADLPGRAQVEHARSHTRPHERRDDQPLPEPRLH